MTFEEKLNRMFLDYNLRQKIVLALSKLITQRCSERKLSVPTVIVTTDTSYANILLAADLAKIEEDPIFVIPRKRIILGHWTQTESRTKVKNIRLFIEEFGLNPSFDDRIMVVDTFLTNLRRTEDFVNFLTDGALNVVCVCSFISLINNRFITDRGNFMREIYSLIHFCSERNNTDFSKTVRESQTFKRQTNHSDLKLIEEEMQKIGLI